MTRDALLICDMWDVHWCRSATARTAELAVKIDAFARKARAAGVFVIHSPADATSHYESWPQRDRMRRTSVSSPPAEHETDEPAFIRPDRARVCPDEPPCPIAQGPAWPWTRQHVAIGIEGPDGVSEDGLEIFGALEQLGIERLMFAGVHTDQCVLDRPYGIRQMRRWGVDCAIVSDLTEAFWPEDTPAVVGHIGAHLCPVVMSTDVVA